MNIFYKAVLEGNLDKAVEIAGELLEDYREDFFNYYNLISELSKVFNPEVYYDKAGNLKSSLIAVMKKAYKNRDFETVSLIKEIIQILEDFEVKDDIYG